MVCTSSLEPVIKELCKLKSLVAWCWLCLEWLPWILAGAASRGLPLPCQFHPEPVVSTLLHIHHISKYISFILHNQKLPFTTKYKMHFLSFHFSTIPNSMLLCNCKTPMCRSKMNIFLKKNECHQIILTDAVNWLTKQLFPNLSSLFASHYKKANYVGGDHMTDCWPMRH